MNKYLNFRLIVVLCCLISLTSCHKSLDPASDYIMYDDSKGLIGAGGGQITFNDQNSPLNGSSITFPQGALKKSTLITIKDITADLAVEYKTKIPLALELLPDGLVFNAPPSMKIIVSDKISLEESSFIGPFDKNSGYVLWHKSEVDLSEGTISTEIEHFSLWAYVTNFKITEDDYTYILKNCPKRTCYLGPNLLTECNNDASRSFNKWQTFSIYYSKCS